MSTRQEFFAAVERDLQLRHVPFDQAELRDFLDACWPMIEHGDTAEQWAEAFLVGAVEV